MSDFSPSSFRRPKIAPSALPSNTVLVDQTRTRTSWFEGMFVTAQQFNRDQSYTIARQSDLGLAIGAGVVEGLEVTQAPDDPTALIVAAGLGISGGGESIVLHNDLRIPLADIALQKGLAQDAGLVNALQLNAESRTGCFILCATPVEFTSNPEGSYASGANGQRELRDSVINEATLFTLVPFSLPNASKDPIAQRALAARRMFVEKVVADLPPSSLPLAMMQLDGNALGWLDMYLVRRQAGAGRADDYGLGYVDTPNRAAHAVQYEAMLSDILASAPGQGFAAVDHFDVLPPMGRMPAASIASRAPAPGLTPVLSQLWLPAEMPVELTALPEDEVAQHLAESLSMPPIDLHATSAVLAQTPVTVIIPIPRAEWANAPLEVQQTALSLKAATPLGAAPNTPGDLIKALLDQAGDDILDEPGDETAWRTLLNGRQTLWFMRRRQVLRTDDLAGEAYAFQIGVSPGDGPEIEDADQPPAPVVDVPSLLRPVVDPATASLRELLTPYGLTALYDSIRTAETEDGFQARADLNAFLTRALYRGSSLAVTEIVKRAAAIGDLPRSEMSRLGRTIPLGEIAPRFVPMEALLIGGPVRFRFAIFPPEAASPSINANVARALNDGLAVIAADRPTVPADMAKRVKDLLSAMDLPSEVITATLASGSGEIPVPDPRSLDLRMMLLKSAIELGTPLVSSLADPGTIEAQTRRNLLYRTDMIPKLMEGLAKAELVEILDALPQHTEAMDKALSQDSATAIKLATQGVEALLAGR